MVYYCGHRGDGDTDNLSAQKNRPVKELPVENTLLSIRKAFLDGADCVEVDANVSKKGRDVFCLHSIVQAEHNFGPHIRGWLGRSLPLNKVNFDEISEKIRTGPFQNGIVCTLADMLEEARKRDPLTGPWVMDVELKGAQDSAKQKYDGKILIPAIGDVIKNSEINSGRIIQSSFTLQNIIAASYECDKSMPTQFAMLFEEDAAWQPIYTNNRKDKRFQYIPFNMKNIDYVMNTWEREARPGIKLTALHPNITAIGEKHIKLAAESQLAINSWAMNEILDDETIGLYRSFDEMTQKHDVSAVIITNEHKALRRALTMN